MICIWSWQLEVGTFRRLNQLPVMWGGHLFLQLCKYIFHGVLTLPICEESKLLRFHLLLLNWTKMLSLNSTVILWRKKKILVWVSQLFKKGIAETCHTIHLGEISEQITFSSSWQLHQENFNHRNTSAQPEELNGIRNIPPQFHDWHKSCWSVNENEHLVASLGNLYRRTAWADKFDLHEQSKEEMKRENCTCKQLFYKQNYT